MKGIYATINDYTLPVSKIADSLWCKCLSAFRSLGVKLAQFKSLVAKMVAPRTHSIVKLEHLHKSCNSMQPHQRAVFILYIKGYSLDEISAKTGAKRHTITPIVHRTLKTMPRQDHIS